MGCGVIQGSEAGHSRSRGGQTGQGKVRYGSQELYQTFETRKALNLHKRSIIRFWDHSGVRGRSFRVKGRSSMADKNYTRPSKLKRLKIYIRGQSLSFWVIRGSRAGHSGSFKGQGLVIRGQGR